MLLNGRARFLIFTLLVIVLGGMLAYWAQHSPVLFSSDKRSASCLGDASKISFKINPKFYLNKRFLNSNKLTDADIRNYIEKHIRYVYLAMPSYSKAQTPKFSAIPYGGFSLSNIQMKDAKYPLALKTSWTDVNPYFRTAMDKRVDIDSLYMKKAVEVGSTSLQDDAFEIAYEAEVQLILCEDGNRTFGNVVNLPADPFLGFWFVPEEMRVRKFHQVSKKEEPITPCANDEFLYDHDPYYYWHYFSLDEPACRERILPKAVESFPVRERINLSINDSQPFTLDFIDKVRSRDLKMTVNFTLIDDDSVFVKELFYHDLRPKIESIVAIPDFPSAKDAITQLDMHDVALQSGLIFSWSIKSLSEKFEFNFITSSEQLMQWRLRGQLKQSLQKYDLLVTMGSAMQESGSYSQFYAALNQGFASSDIVYFGGHAGVGKNLSENRIQEGVTDLYNTLSADQIPEHQLLMLMTCYSLHYFPPNGFPMPNKPFVRDILGTASVPSGYDARILVGLVEQIDKYLAKGKQTQWQKWPEIYERDLFLVHQRVKK